MQSIICAKTEIDYIYQIRKEKGKMKLSKKIVAVILTVAMAITQLSVFSLADNAYDSGMNDSASYALRVPNQAYVQYNQPSSTSAPSIRSTPT